MDIYEYQIGQWQGQGDDAPGGPIRAVSCLPPDRMKALGMLPNRAILGVIDRNAAPGTKLSPELFSPNEEFIRFMHHVIRTFGPDDPSMQAVAKAQGKGWLYVIDLRTPDGPQGRVPPEDIIGAFQIQDGVVVRGEYWANDKHALFSADGFVKLPESLASVLIRELGKAQG